MAIIQISKIQQRTGNLVDLPQLDEAEFGWATDAKRLFIGKSVPNENIEVLTSYSNISFSQVTGSDGGNLNVTNAQTGQFLTYVRSTNTWQNSGGNSLQPGNSALYTTNNIHLGNVGNVKLGGGAIGYVLQTDGTGNLTWSSKGTITANIIALSNATPIVMSVATSIPYTNGTGITITGVNGVANSNVNSKIFYVKVSSDFPTSGNVSLYTTADLAAGNAAIGTLLTYTNSANALAITSVGGGGATAANGSTYSVQFNNSGIISGDSNITWDFNNRIFAVSGNANITGNINGTANIVGSRLVSNVATGTTPLVVTSTTRVANLNVATSGIANTVNDAAQGNITSVGTLTSVSVSGNANVGNIGTGGLITATGNITGANLVTGGLITATGNITGANLVTGGLITATGNITGANLVTGGLITAIGNANVGNLGTGGLITATGNITGGNLIGPHASGNSNITIASNANISMYVAGNANVRFVVTDTGANITGTLSVSGNANVGNIGATTFVGALSGAATTSGTVTTNAQPNITSTGTLTSVSVSGNANIGNIGTGGLITATGNITGGNLVGPLASGNSNISITSNANITMYVAGNANARFTITSTGANLTGTLSASGNVNVANLGVALITATGNITGANLLTGGIVSATGNITGGNLILANASTITTGANTNVGYIDGNWQLTAGSRMTATYADLAEYYEADKDYDPATVLEFGGEKEVTLASDGTARVAGVVSTNPAYAMNANCQGIAVAIALQGRVPTKVRGFVRKGDMMVSAGDGYARPSLTPQMGTVIGKALENFDGIEGVIEVAVGRL